MLSPLLLALAIAGSAPSPAAERVGAAGGSNEVARPTVDVNLATVEELVSVPGIGDVLARRIVEFRTKNGPFERVDDLLKVRGIGEKSLEKLRPYIRAGARK